MIKYATISSDRERVLFKRCESGEPNTFQLLKQEIKGTLGCIAVQEIDIWYDDEFLLKDEVDDITLIVKRSNTNQITELDIVLRGNLVLASNDDEGNTISLSNKALDYISKKLFNVQFNGKKTYLLEAY